MVWRSGSGLWKGRTGGGVNTLIDQDGEHGPDVGAAVIAGCRHPVGALDGEELASLAPVDRCDVGGRVGGDHLGDGAVAAGGHDLAPGDPAPALKR